MSADKSSKPLECWAISDLIQASNFLFEFSQAVAEAQSDEDPNKGLELRLFLSSRRW